MLFPSEKLFRAIAPTRVVSHSMESFKIDGQVFLRATFVETFIGGQTTEVSRRWPAEAVIGSPPGPTSLVSRNDIPQKRAPHVGNEISFRLMEYLF